MGQIQHSWRGQRGSTIPGLVVESSDHDLLGALASADEDSLLVLFGNHDTTLSTCP